MFCMWVRGSPGGAMQSGGARQVGRIRMRCRGSMAMPLAAQLLMSILYAVPVAPSIGGQDGLLVQRIWAMDPRHSRERSTEKLHGDSAGFRQLLRLRGGESKSSQAQVPTLVILRHGQSLWNQENRFTGWMDVPLAEQGIHDAHRAADMLRKEGLVFDVAYTSVLQRAIKTMIVILEDMGQIWIPQHCDWRLNERHDGVLTGLNKKLAVQQYGEENIKEWRRGFAVTPPPLDQANPCWPGHDVKYDHIEGFSKRDLPLTESLEDTLARTLPCWTNRIANDLKEGKTVLVVTHGNTVRALAKFLDSLSEDTIVDVDIPSTVPMVYKFSKTALGELHAIATPMSWAPLSAVFLGDHAEIQAAMKKVKAETKTQMWARDIRQLLRRNNWGGLTQDTLKETWIPSGTVTIGRHLQRMPSLHSGHWFKGGRAFVKPQGPPGHDRLPFPTLSREAMSLGAVSSGDKHSLLQSGEHHATKCAEGFAIKNEKCRDIAGHDRLPIPLRKEEMIVRGAGVVDRDGKGRDRSI